MIPCVFTEVVPEHDNEQMPQACIRWSCPMTDDPTTDGVPPDRLVRLLEMATTPSEHQAETPDDASEKSDSLNRLLAGPLPAQDAMVDSLPGIIQQVHKELLPHDGKPLAALLEDPATDLGVMRCIKTFTKQRAKLSGIEVDREAATVVYYAAIAHALVYGDKRITGLSYESLKESCAELVLNDWLDAGLIELFNRAIAVCSEKSGMKSD